MNNNNFVRKIVMYFECNVKFWSDLKKIVKIAKLIKILQELISFDFKFQNMLYIFKYTAFNCDNNFHAVYPSFDIFDIVEAGKTSKDILFMIQGFV